MASMPFRFRPRIAIIHDVSPAFTENILVAFAKKILKSYDALVYVSSKMRGEVRDILGLNYNRYPNTYEVKIF